MVSSPKLLPTSLELKMVFTLRRFMGDLGKLSPYLDKRDCERARETASPREEGVRRFSCCEQ